MGLSRKQKVVMGLRFAASLMAFTVSVAGTLVALALGFVVGLSLTILRLFIAMIAFQVFGGIAWGFPFISMWLTFLFASGVSVFYTLFGLVEHWVFREEDANAAD